MPGVGFIRVKLLQCERGGSPLPDNETFDPYVAINVKEAVNLAGKLNYISNLVYCTYSRFWRSENSRYIGERGAGWHRGRLAHPWWWETEA